jgi:hypothetical protein
MDQQFCHHPSHYEYFIMPDLTDSYRADNFIRPTPVLTRNICPKFAVMWCMEFGICCWNAALLMNWHWGQIFNHVDQFRLRLWVFQGIELDRVLAFQKIQFGAWCSRRSLEWLHCIAATLWASFLSAWHQHMLPQLPVCPGLLFPDHARHYRPQWHYGICDLISSWISVFYTSNHHPCVPIRARSVVMEWIQTWIWAWRGFGWSLCSTQSLWDQLS